MNVPADFAPEIIAEVWLNVPEPLTLAALRGRVVVLEAFQMLCPGCVHHSLPQAQRVAAHFRPDELQVIGLHAVFEHREVQGSQAALAAFLHENRIGFPVAIDRQSGPIPATMLAYSMQGTPTTILIDTEGRQRAQYFGSVSDLALGTVIGRLLQPSKDPS